MELTRDFRESVRARIDSDAAFRVGLLRDALDCLGRGEVLLARELLRDLVEETEQSS